MECPRAAKILAVPVVC